MHILIIRNGHIIARTEEDGQATEYSIMTVETLPEYPHDGKEYELDLVNGSPAWIERPHTPTLQEQIDALNERMDEQQYPWKPGEQVYRLGDPQSPHPETADRRYYSGTWYTCIQSHVTQVGWTPDIVPALWQAEAGA